MVNHIKTLLLNKSAEDCSKAPNRFYISSSFVPVALQGELALAWERLYSGCDTVEDMIDRTDALYSIVNRVDFKEHVHFYDDRTTQPLNQVSMYPHVDFVQIFLDGTRSEILFRPTGIDALDAELLKLKDLANSIPDGHASVAAKILAYVLQVEARMEDRDGR